MRKLIYSAATSLDGYIAAADGAIDWLHFSKDVQTELAAFWPTIDAVLLGRHTYEAAAGAVGAGGGMQTFVFSRTLKQLAAPGAELVHEDAGDFVRALKQRPGKSIWLMGGGALACSLFAAGVIDEVHMNVHPVMLGSGVPFFRDAGKRTKLRLESARTIDGGCVIARYAVRAGKRDTAPGI